MNQYLCFIETNFILLILARRSKHINKFCFHIKSEICLVPLARLTNIWTPQANDLQSEGLSGMVISKQEAEEIFVY